MGTTSVIAGIGGISQAEGDLRYIRKNGSSFVESGYTIYFADAGSNIRIKNGKLQIRNDQDQSWYSLGCKNIDGDVPNFYVIEPGVS